MAAANNETMTPFGVPPRGILGKSVPPSISWLPLPTAQIFIEPLRRDVEELLGEFVREWTAAVASAEEAVGSIAPDADAGGSDAARRAALLNVANGPVYLFESIWIKKGWCYVQLVCGEDDVSRSAFFDSIFRVFQEHLLPLLETSDTANESSTQLMGVAALFGTYLLWGTQPRMERIWTSVKEDPDKGVKDNIRVWIELDLYNVLMHLPQTAEPAMRLSEQLQAALQNGAPGHGAPAGDASDDDSPPYVAPIEDVFQILQVMTDRLSDEDYALHHAYKEEVEIVEDTLDAEAVSSSAKGKGRAREDTQPEQGSWSTGDMATANAPPSSPPPRTGEAFLIMPPTTFKTRPPMPDNVCVPDMDEVRMSGKYGRMKKRRQDATTEQGPAGGNVAQGATDEGHEEAMEVNANPSDDQSDLVAGLIPSELVRSIIQARLSASADYQDVLASIIGPLATSAATANDSPVTNTDNAAPGAPTVHIPAPEIEAPTSDLPKGRRHGNTWKEIKSVGWDKLKSRVEEAGSGGLQDGEDEQSSRAPASLDTAKAISELKDLADVREKYASMRNKALQDWSRVLAPKVGIASGSSGSDGGMLEEEGEEEDEEEDDEEDPSLEALTGPQILALARERTVQRMKEAKERAATEAQS